MPLIKSQRAIQLVKVIPAMFSRRESPPEKMSGGIKSMTRKVPPAIQDGVVYIGSGINGSAVVALRLASDEDLKAAGQDRLLWKSETPFPATGAVSLVDELVLIGCGNGDYVYAAPNPEGAVLAFDQSSGEERCCPLRCLP